VEQATTFAEERLENCDYGREVEEIMAINLSLVNKASWKS
jgi:hypothetical protein